MSSDAQKMWDAAIGIARAFHDHPTIKAYYKEEARRNRIKQEAEEAAAKAKRDAEIEKKQRERAYDNYVLSGGSDPCFQAGHSGHCGTSMCSLFDEESVTCPNAEWDELRAELRQAAVEAPAHTWRFHDPEFSKSFSA